MASKNGLYPLPCRRLGPPALVNQEYPLDPHASLRRPHIIFQEGGDWSTDRRVLPKTHIRHGAVFLALF